MRYIAITISIVRLETGRPYNFRLSTELVHGPVGLKNFSEETIISDLSINTIREFFPKGTVVLTAPVRDHMDELHETEKSLVNAAVQKRRAEFSTGRVLAAKALYQLGVPVQPVLKGKSNEPIWPAGMVGSITHTSKTCVVVLAFDNTVSGIGIDVESRDAGVRNVARLILRKEEQEECIGKEGAEYDDLVRVIFSAKEAVFKAVFAQVKRFIEFDEVRLILDSGGRSFGAIAPDDDALNEVVSAGKGRVVCYEDNVVTGFFLPVSNSS